MATLKKFVYVLAKHFGMKGDHLLIHKKQKEIHINIHIGL
jgi:hypothetical protein